MRDFATAWESAKTLVHGPFFWRGAWRVKAREGVDGRFRMLGPFTSRDIATREATRQRIQRGLIAAGCHEGRAASIASRWLQHGAGTWHDGFAWGYKIATRYESLDSPDASARIDAIADRIRNSGRTA